MQARWMGIAAVAALSLAGRGWANEGHKVRGTGETGQIGDTPATQQEQTAGGQQADKATQPETSTDRSSAAAAEHQAGRIEVIGTVEKMQGDKLTVNKGTGGDTEELNLDAETRFTTQDGSAISRDDLEEGDQVRAAFNGDSKEATEVQLIRKSDPAHQERTMRSHPGGKADEPMHGKGSDSSDHSGSSDHSSSSDQK